MKYENPSVNHVVDNISKDITMVILKKGNIQEPLRVNLKTKVTRKQSTSNSPENEYFLPPDTHKYVSWKIWCALFSCYLRFEIRPFVL